jgi:hypothetical protein
LLAKLRPVDPVDVVRCQLAHQHLDDFPALDAKMTAVRAQIVALVAATGTRLTELYGIGPIIAGGSWPKWSGSIGSRRGIFRVPQRHRTHRRLLW